ncbi:MAG: DUF1772 domain-containing protein [Acidobacteriaceae bacterium]|nr:DUF1772 domain-containing protein [Acidobacteriaceae bacterium]
MLTLQIASILVLGLMCGSELNVAAFAHPTLNRQPLDTHIRMRSSFAVLLGGVMPFWMGGSTLLNLALLFPFAHLTGTAWRLTATSAAIQVLAVIFSLIGPVPINNRVKTWTPDSLPADWQAQERRWDLYHWVRTIGLIIAFTLLLASLALP